VVRYRVLAGVLWISVACAPTAHVMAEPAIRVVSAPQIRVVSAPQIGVVSAAKVAKPVAAETPKTAVPVLPAPHKVATDPPAIQAAADLRKLVGRRDKHKPSTLALGWAHDLGALVEATDGPTLVAWARTQGKLAASGEAAEPGDLLVFDHVESDAEADLVAIVIARDNRNVIEFLYAGGGVIRRGFCDAKHPSARRDHGIVVNTYLRSGTRYPPKGTHYLAGELLSHVVHAR
jgi:hypothetical protein